MATRYQVFISSTYRDLKQERDQVIKQVLTMGHIPVGMEMFSADDAEQWEVIQREIDQSDYYLVIVKHRYGSVIKQEGGISFTEKEFDYAGEVGVPRIGFIVADGVAVLPEEMEDSPALRRKLATFKKKVMSKPVTFWSTPEDLGTQVLQALTKQIAKGKRPGWERASEDSMHALASFARLSDENAQLREENARLKELTAVKAPELDCQFVTARGKVVGRELRLAAPDLAAVDKYQQQLLAEISSLVEKIDQTADSYNIHDTLVQMTAVPAFASLHEPYKMDPKRVTQVMSRLSALELPAPTRHWAFANLLRHSALLQLPGGTRGSSGEPVGGQDFERYSYFKLLEEKLSDFRGSCDTKRYEVTHAKFGLRLFNTGKVSAEDFTVRVEFPLKTQVSDDTVDLTPRKPLRPGLRTSYSFKLLVPDESHDIMSFTMGTHGVDSEISLDVRITGRNLPGAQIIPLTIRIGETADALPAPVN